MRTLEGQVALVTGAGRGIGREIALGLAEEGMNLGVLGRHRDTLTGTLRACVRHGVRCVALAADVTNPNAVREAVRSVERDLGPVDLLVNNAGQVDGPRCRCGRPTHCSGGRWWRPTCGARSI